MTLVWRQALIQRFLRMGVGWCAIGCRTVAAQLRIPASSGAAKLARRCLPLTGDEPEPIENAEFLFYPSPHSRYTSLIEPFIKFIANSQTFFT